MEIFNHGYNFLGNPIFNANLFKRKCFIKKFSQFLGYLKVLTILCYTKLQKNIHQFLIFLEVCNIFKIFTKKKGCINAKYS